MSKHDGERFGRLAVLRTERAGKNYWCECKCDCGSIVRVNASNLVSGGTKSCGCLKKELLSVTKSTHGESKTRLYRIWKAMRQRCNNPADHFFHIYGGAGVKVCSEWDDYQSFANWAYQSGYTDELTIDRIDPKGDYEPSNCRWATWTEQARNKQDTIFITIGGDTKPLVEWCKEKGVLYGTALYRFRKMNMTGEDLFSYKRTAKASGYNSGEVWAEE